LLTKKKPIRIPRSDEDLLKTLEEEVDKLKELYFKTFREEDLKYLGDVAGKLRVLVYEGGKNKPLLLHLMDKFEINILITLDGPPVQPLPGQPSPGDKITLRRFLDLLAVEIRVKSGDFMKSTKKELIAKWSQQSGGAHQDWELDEDLFAMQNTGINLFGMPPEAHEFKATTKTVLHVAKQFFEKINKNN